MSQMKINLAQISKQDNFKNVEKIIRENNSSDLIVFPETTFVL